MPEFANAGDGARFPFFALHNDVEDEYDYGPAQGLRAARVGTYTQALCDESVHQVRVVVSMRNDGKRVIAIE
jgi:hypothetical protein